MNTAHPLSIPASSHLIEGTNFPVIVAKDLTREFGKFVAVGSLQPGAERIEIFGSLRGLTIQGGTYEYGI